MLISSIGVNQGAAGLSKTDATFPDADKTRAFSKGAMGEISRNWKTKALVAVVVAAGVTAGVAFAATPPGWITIGVGISAFAISYLAGTLLQPEVKELPRQSVQDFDANSFTLENAKSFEQTLPKALKEATVPDFKLYFDQNIDEIKNWVSKDLDRMSVTVEGVQYDGTKEKDVKALHQKLLALTNQDQEKAKHLMSFMHQGSLIGLHISLAGVLMDRLPPGVYPNTIGTETKQLEDGTEDKKIGLTSDGDDFVVKLQICQKVIHSQLPMKIDEKTVKTPVAEVNLLQTIRLPKVDGEGTSKLSCTVTPLNCTQE